MRAKRSSAETRPNELSEHRRLVLWQECNHTTGAAPHRLLVVIKRVRVRPSAQYVCQSALHMCEAAGGSDRIRKYTDRTHFYAFASTQESEDNATIQIARQPKSVARGRLVACTAQLFGW